MALPQWIYFRATDDQVDPADADAEIGTTANYPRTTPQGNSVGYESLSSGHLTRDRNTTTSVLLKGMHATSVTDDTLTSTYRIDLPSTGDHEIRMAAGDSAGSWDTRVRFQDGSTTFQDYNAASSNVWLDATGVNRANESAWVTSNAVLTRTFASTIFRVITGGATNRAALDGTAMAALYIDFTGSAVTAATINRFSRRRGKRMRALKRFA